MHTCATSTCVQLGSWGATIIFWHTGIEQPKSNIGQGMLGGRHVVYSIQKETNTCLQYQWCALNLAILTQCTKPLNWNYCLLLNKPCTQYPATQKSVTEICRKQKVDITWQNNENKNKNYPVHHSTIPPFQ